MYLLTVLLLFTLLFLGLYRGLYFVLSVLPSWVYEDLFWSMATTMLSAWSVLGGSAACALCAFKATNWLWGVM